MNTDTNMNYIAEKVIDPFTFMPKWGVKNNYDNRVIIEFNNLKDDDSFSEKNFDKTWKEIGEQMKILYAK